MVNKNQIFGIRSRLNTYEIQNINVAANNYLICRDIMSTEQKMRSHSLCLCWGLSFFNSDHGQIWSDLPCFAVWSKFCEQCVFRCLLLFSLYWVLLHSHLFSHMLVPFSRYLMSQGFTFYIKVTIRFYVLVIEPASTQTCVLQSMSEAAH